MHPPPTHTPPHHHHHHHSSRYCFPSSFSNHTCFELVWSSSVQCSSRCSLRARGSPYMLSIPSFESLPGGVLTFKHLHGVWSSSFMLLYTHRERKDVLLGRENPEQPPRLSHSSRALLATFWFSSVLLYVHGNHKDLVLGAQDGRLDFDAYSS